MNKRFLLAFALLCLSVPAFAQTSVTVNAPREDATAGNGDRGIPMLVRRCDSAVSTASADGKYAVLCADSSGNLRVAIGAATITAMPADSTELPAAAALADNTANPTVPAVGAYNMCWDGSTWDRCPTGTGGVGASDANTTRIVPAQVTPFKSLDLDESEEDVKTSPGEVCSLWVTNTATSTRWVKFYNATAANVTVGTTIPLVTIGVPGNTSDDVSGSFSANNGCIAFGVAISIAATTAVADTDTGAPAANDVVVMVGFR